MFFAPWRRVSRNPQRLIFNSKDQQRINLAEKQLERAVLYINLVALTFLSEFELHLKTLSQWLQVYVQYISNVNFVR